MMTYQQRIDSFKRSHGIGARNRNPRSPALNAPRGRQFDMGAVDRLSGDWRPMMGTGDSNIQFDLQMMRDRSRDMEINNEYISRFLTAVPNNVLQDEVGFSLQMQVRRPPDFTVPDVIACDKIEQAWKRWCRKENCTNTGEEAFFDVLNLSLRSAARDGGIAIRKIKQDGVNEFGFTLKLIEIDYIDHNYTTILPNGNFVIMGIEKTPEGRRVAYHILARHPGDLLFGSSPFNRTRVAGDEIIHYFVKQRVTQSHGVPWVAPVGTRLRQLAQYELAEVVAAREAAVKGGYFTSATGQPYAGEKETTTNADGTVTESGTLNDFEIGQRDQLPAGTTFTAYDPTHPTQQYGDFVRSCLLGISAGLNISYATMTGDLSEANYSSMRAGSLEEREGYKKIQGHMIRHLVLEIFSSWLEWSLTTGAINLPFDRFAQFNHPKFTGRRWPWVDPSKDVESSRLEVESGFNTRTRIAEENGRDYEETVETLAYEKTLAADAGLDFSGKKGVDAMKNAEQQVTNASA